MDVVSGNFCDVMYMYIPTVKIIHGCKKYMCLASNPGLLPPRGKKLRDLLTPSERKGGRRPGQFHHVMLAAGDVTSYKQYIFYMPNTILHCL